MIDLFSDTKTKPTPGMRQFMAQAEVGDEQKGEDPTVNVLCERVAAMLGHEDAVYLPSGTMCNELAIHVHCRPGEQVICDRTAHVITAEGGGPAALSGVMINAIHGHRGKFTGAQLAAVASKGSRYQPASRLVCIEQTSNLGGGTPWRVDEVNDVIAHARKLNLTVHMDGARLLNATTELKVEPIVFTKGCDSAWIDFSKGLGAPVGAVLTGTKAFIQEAWRYKQMWGGAMRQAGIIAAGALYALDHHVDRLAEDHQNAKMLARALAQIPGIALDASTVETNIVLFDVAGLGITGEQFVSELRKHGVITGVFGPTLVRAVTHLDVSKDDTQKAIEAVGALARNLDPPRRAKT